MAQVRRHTRNPSPPPPRQIPSLPDAVHLHSTSTRNIRRSQSFQIHDLPQYGGSPIRATYQQQQLDTNHSLYPPSQTNAFYNKYDSLTGLSINPTNTHDNYKQPYIISSPLNRITTRERQQLPPPAPPPSSVNLYSVPPQHYQQSRLNNHEVRAMY